MTKKDKQFSNDVRRQCSFDDCFNNNVESIVQGSVSHCAGILSFDIEYT